MNLNAIVDALDALMDAEAGRGAEEGLAYTVAASLKAEVLEDSAPLENLPLLKKAILDYALAQAE